MSNECTRIDLNVELPQFPPSRLQDAYERVRARLGIETATTTSGYSLWWTDGGELQRASIGESADSAVVVGRHSQCDAVLSSDEHIGLRHFLARCRRNEDNVMEVEFISLKSHLPFLLPDGSQYGSLRACGCLCTHLGGYALIAIPNGARASALPDFVPQPELKGTNPGTGWSEESVSQIAPRANAAILAELPRSAAAMRGRLCIRSGEREHVIWLNREHLRRGVILGRYARCVGGPMREIFTDSVSRTHALLIGKGEDIDAYDLSSRNGIWQGRKRRRSILLTQAGTAFSLGRRGAIEVSWHGGISN